MSCKRSADVRIVRTAGAFGQLHGSTPLRRVSWRWSCLSSVVVAKCNSSSVSTASATAVRGSAPRRAMSGIVVRRVAATTGDTRRRRKDVPIIAIGRRRSEDPRGVA